MIKDFKTGPFANLRSPQYFLVRLFKNRGNIPRENGSFMGDLTFGDETFTNVVYPKLVGSLRFSIELFFSRTIVLLQANQQLALKNIVSSMGYVFKSTTAGNQTYKVISK